MRPAATLGVYAAALAVVFGAAVGVGNAVGPVGTAGSDDTHTAADGGHSASGPATGDAPAQPASGGDLEVGGLAVSQDGYSLRLASTTVPAATPTTFAFTVTGPDGQPVTDYVRTHDEDLHLVVARRDLTGYQHVHPELGPDGRWSVPLTFPAAGPYKVFADFTPAGRDDGLTLAADVTVPGSYTPAPPLLGDTVRDEVDGYEVALDGRLVAGTSSRLVLTVTKDGRPVTDLEPYLGAYGHLVALRDGDLAYLHVHPDEEVEGSGPEVVFYADVPAAAGYRLFLDFQHVGVVRTADLTVTATRAGDTAATSTGPPPTAPAAGHDATPHGH